MVRWGLAQLGRWITTLYPLTWFLLFGVGCTWSAGPCAGGLEAAGQVGFQRGFDCGWACEGRGQGRAALAEAPGDKTQQGREVRCSSIKGVGGGWGLGEKGASGEE